MSWSDLSVGGKRDSLTACTLQPLVLGAELSGLRRYFSSFYLSKVTYISVCLLLYVQCWGVDFNVFYLLI